MNSPQANICHYVQSDIKKKSQGQWCLKIKLFRRSKGEVMTTPSWKDDVWQACLEHCASFRGPFGVYVVAAPSPGTGWRQTDSRSWNTNVLRMPANIITSLQYVKEQVTYTEWISVLTKQNGFTLCIILYDLHIPYFTLTNKLNSTIVTQGFLLIFILQIKINEYWIHVVLSQNCNGGKG